MVEHDEQESPAHEHIWQFLYTYEDWWDGDEDDVYGCVVVGCKARDRRYIGR